MEQFGSPVLEASQELIQSRSRGRTIVQAAFSGIKKKHILVSIFAVDDVPRDSVTSAVLLNASHQCLHLSSVQVHRALSRILSGNIDLRRRQSSKMWILENDGDALNGLLSLMADCARLTNGQARSSGFDQERSSYSDAKSQRILKVQLA
jgi:hypothetical protein